MGGGGGYLLIIREGTDGWGHIFTAGLGLDFHNSNRVAFSVELLE